MTTHTVADVRYQCRACMYTYDECPACPHHRAAHATGSSEMGAMGEMRLITPDDIAELIRRDVHETRRGPAPTADPRECPACPHHRIAHTSWGCDHCSCGVSIVDLTGLGVLHV